jgi:hypothetical protein
MREIMLRTIEVDLKNITSEDKKIPFSYKETILSLLNGIVDKGMTIEDIEKRIRIRNKVMNSETILKLEEVDYEYLKILVLEEKWKIADQSIIDFVNEIKNTKQVE